MSYRCERCGVDHADSETHEQALARLTYAHDLAVRHRHTTAARDLARTLERMKASQ